MAERQCAACGGQISSYATTCPWCGRNVFMFRMGSIALAAVLVWGGMLVLRATRGSELRDALLSDEASEFTGARQGEQPEWLLRAADWLEGDEVAAARRVGRILTGAALAEASPSGQRQRSACVKRDSGWVARLVGTYPALSDADLMALACGRVRAGFTEDQLRFSLGDPRRVVRRQADSVEEWVYGRSRFVIRQGRVEEVRR